VDVEKNVRITEHFFTTTYNNLFLLQRKSGGHETHCTQIHSILPSGQYLTRAEIDKPCRIDTAAGLVGFLLTRFNRSDTGLLDMICFC
jgi:hypothetical protein